MSSSAGLGGSRISLISDSNNILEVLLKNRPKGQQAFPNKGVSSHQLYLPKGLTFKIVYF